ncbi:MAG: T9SS type A sorting domain-containing protein, partial [Salibacteraceae bacterium]
GIVQIYNASGLSSGEYLFWGEDQINSSYEFSTSSNYMEQCSSTWRVSETGNVGTVSVSFDASLLDLSNKQSCATLSLVVSNVQNFSSKTSYPLTLEGNHYTANNVSFSDEDYFTLEYQDVVVVDNSSFTGGSGSSNAPGTGDACYKLLVKSSANGSLNIAENAHVREVEIETGATINIENAIYLIVDGDIVNNGTLSIEENGSLNQTKLGVNANSGTGTYTIARSGNTSSYVYNIWASPITTASLTSVFSDANPCDIWTFEESTQAWKYDYANGYSANCYGNSVTFGATDVISGGDGIMNVTRGYFIPGDLTAQRVYSGEVNNGDYSIAIKATNLGNPGTTDWRDDDWNLLGNPYPSALSASAFWQENAIDNNRIRDGLYFWDEADTTGGYNQDSDYAAWNLGGAVNSGNTAEIPLGNIASGQGFWVAAQQNTSVVFNNSMRSTSNNQFFKNIQSQNHNAWFSFVSPSNHINNILVGYNENATDSIDNAYDAHKLVGNSPVRFASVIAGDEFMIQSLAPIPLNSSKTIPLVVFTNENGIHTFTNYKRENLADGFKIYIRDKQLGINFDLGTGDYQVDLVANTTYSHRFELVYKNLAPKAIGPGDIKDGNLTKPNLTSQVTSAGKELKSAYSLAYSANGYSLVNESGINGTVKVMDITGKTVWTKNVNNNSTSVLINLNQITAGIYFIEVTNNKQRVYSNKILKQ